MVKMNKLPSVERLHELFELRGGHLYWRISKGRARAGDRAGSSHRKGYLGISVDGKRRLAHRIVWLMNYGVIPDGMDLDHINGDKLDNRIENLRLATRSENSRNRQGANTDSQTGIRGVSLHKSSLWHAQVQVDGKKIQRYFKSKIVAVIFVDLVRTKYFGDFYSPLTTPGLAELLA